MIKISHSGNFKKTERFFDRVRGRDHFQILDKYGKEGVRALASATPQDSGLTVQSWGYEVKITKGNASITWLNSNIVDGVPIAIIIQYGHGTGSGGYVQGRDYINPALRPILDALAQKIWEEVTK